MTKKSKMNRTERINKAFDRMGITEILLGSLVSEAQYDGFVILVEKLAKDCNFVCVQSCRVAGITLVLFSCETNDGNELEYLWADNKWNLVDFDG